ncbi:MAG: PHP domain-containing protein [Kiritimatiellia bacterium]
MRDRSRCASAWKATTSRHGELAARAARSAPPFDYILGSVHYFGHEYMARFHTGRDDDFLAAYFSNLCASAESGLFDCLAHPDLIKNHFGDRWNFAAAEPLIAVALDRIARTGVAMELNTSGMIKTIPEMNPGPRMLRMIAERKIPVVLGSDSHMPARVGDRFEEALSMLETAGFTACPCSRSGKRIDIPIKQARLRTQGRAGGLEIRRTERADITRPATPPRARCGRRAGPARPWPGRRCPGR